MERFPRYEKRAAIQSLTRRLKLLPYWTSDDWALEAAEPARIREFCQFYVSARPPLTADEKFALMALIVASLDDYLVQTPPSERDPALCAQVERLLRRDYSLHAPTIESWCHEDSDASGDSSDTGEEDGYSPAAAFASDGENLEDFLDNDAGWTFFVTPLMRRIRSECCRRRAGTIKNKTKDSKNPPPPPLP